MNNSELQVGCSQRVINPPLGVAMSGWANRAAGDNLAHYIHDDIHVKALCVEGENSSWVLVTAEVGAVDAVATEKIRNEVSQKTGLKTDSIMVCATHCHSAPTLCPIALACSAESFKSNTVNGKNSNIKDNWQSTESVPGITYENAVHQEWRTHVIDQAIDAVVDAYETKRPATVAYGESEISGVGSSRRILMKDGTWADPRKCQPVQDEIAAETEIDPAIRNMFFKDAATKSLIAVLTNYGSHQWLFPISGISAELAGATADKVSKHFVGNPLVIYTTGPEGDVSTIWNLDIENLWKERVNETKEESLKRREQIFDSELNRLSTIMLKGVIESFDKVTRWESESDITSFRHEINLPFKKGYHHLPGIFLTEWQKNATGGHHLTEVQLLQLDEMVIMGLPGEPFTSIGRQIRERFPFKQLIIAALANDCGSLTYIPDADAYQQGGYEVGISTLDENAGQILIDFWKHYSL